MIDLWCLLAAHTWPTFFVNNHVHIKTEKGFLFRNKLELLVFINDLHWMCLRSESAKGCERHPKSCFSCRTLVPLFHSRLLSLSLCLFLFYLILFSFSKYTEQSLLFNNFPRIQNLEYFYFSPKKVN